MKINIELDKALEETEVLIRAAKMTEEVNGILKKLEEPSVQMISGFAGDTLEILEQADIIRVYAAKGKVYALSIISAHPLQRANICFGCGFTRRRNGWIRRVSYGSQIRRSSI